MEGAQYVRRKKWRGHYQSITFLVVEHVRYSVSQFTLGIPRKNSSCLHTTQRPLWLYVSSSHPFQPTHNSQQHCGTKNPHIRVIPRRPSVLSDSVLLIMGLLLSREKSRESFRTNSTSMWFLILFHVFLTIKTVEEILRCNYLNESYKVVLTFETIDEILNYYHSNESYWNDTFRWYWLLCYTNWCLPLTVYGFCGRSFNVFQFKWKLPISTFIRCCSLCFTKWFLLLSLWMKFYRVPIEMKATDQNFLWWCYLSFCIRSF